MQTNRILSAPVVLPIVRWSDQEHLFVLKEDKVSGRLQEFLKQKLSALHASSAVCVCQLLCTAPLETFQPQVLTNNPGHRRPMNTRLPWYLTDSPVGLQLVLLSGSWLKSKSLTVQRLLQCGHCTVCRCLGRLSTASVSCNFFNSLLAPYIVQLFSGNLSVNLFAVYPFKYKLFIIKILSSSLNTMLIAVKPSVTSPCYDEFPLPQTDRKSK